MKTNVQITSIEAFYRLQSKLSRRENQLLEALKVIQPASDRDLARKLDWEPNMVTGRRNSLAEKGVVIEAYKDISPVTKKRVIYWKVKPVVVATSAIAVGQGQLFDIPQTNERVHA